MSGQFHNGSATHWTTEAGQLAMLDTTKGNYDQSRINGSSSTTTSFAYTDWKLPSAAIINQVDQSEVHQKFVNHKVVEQTNTPHQTLTLQDISAQLLPKL